MIRLISYCIACLPVMPVFLQPTLALNAGQIDIHWLMWKSVRQWGFNITRLSRSVSLAWCIRCQVFECLSVQMFKYLNIECLDI